MRKSNVFSPEAALPRMSWSAANLYNLIARSQNPTLAGQTSFVGSTTAMTMYQQRWRSKRLLRGYHGDHIPERRFKRWFLPTDLPSYQNPAASGSKAPRVGGMFQGVRRNVREGGGNPAEQEGKMPIASLFVREVERRLDTAVFRSCFATSIYEARSFVVQGKVRLNGVRLTDPNHLLQPSDLVSVEASSIPMLKAGARMAETSKRQNEKRQAKQSERRDKRKEEEGDAAQTAAVAEGASEGEASAEAPTETQEPASTSEEVKADSETSATPEKVTEAKPSTFQQRKAEAPLPPGVFRFTLPQFAAPHLFVPPYLEVSFSTCSFIYLRHPTLLSPPANNFSRGDNDRAAPTTSTSDIPSPYPANSELFSLAWEHYAKNAPRVRGEMRRTKVEAKVGRHGFETARKKDEWNRLVAVRRGWLRVIGEREKQGQRTAGAKVVGGRKRRDRVGRTMKANL